MAEDYDGVKKCFEGLSTLRPVPSSQGETDEARCKRLGLPPKPFWIDVPDDECPPYLRWCRQVVRDAFAPGTLWADVVSAAFGREEDALAAIDRLLSTRFTDGMVFPARRRGQVRRELAEYARLAGVGTSDMWRQHAGGALLEAVLSTTDILPFERGLEEHLRKRIRAGVERSVFDGRTLDSKRELPLLTNADGEPMDASAPEPGRWPFASSSTRAGRSYRSRGFAERIDRSLDLARALRDVPGRDIAAWKLRSDGYTDEEIAETLDMSPAAVRQRRSRLQRELRKKLENSS